MSRQFASLIRVAGFTLAACAVLASPIASAGPAITGFSGGSTFPAFNGTNQTIGWEFTVASGAGITVNSLGFLDQSPASPLGQSHQVGIWSVLGVLLGQVTVQTTSTSSGDFRYEAITPIVLDGGATYLIGAAITSPFDDAYVIPASMTIDPSITFDGNARSGSSSGFAAPTTVTPGNGRFGPNFDFTVNAIQAVPEPSMLILTASGLGLLGLGRRRSGHAKRPAASTL